MSKIAMEKRDEYRSVCPVFGKKTNRETGKVTSGLDLTTDECKSCKGEDAEMFAACEAECVDPEDGTSSTITTPPETMVDSKPEKGKKSESPPVTTTRPEQKKKGATGKSLGKKVKRPSGLDAAAKVLAEADEPLGCKEIVKRMLAKELWKTNGKTPDATIYSLIIRDIIKKGDASRFAKAVPGKFTIKT